MNVKKEIASIYSQIRTRQLEIQDLLSKINSIRRMCNHPNDKRVVVTFDDSIDRVSCDECGKVFED